MCKKGGRESEVEGSEQCEKIRDEAVLGIVAND